MLLIQIPILILVILIYNRVKKIEKNLSGQ